MTRAQPATRVPEMKRDVAADRAGAVTDRILGQLTDLQQTGDLKEDESEQPGGLARQVLEAFRYRVAEAVKKAQEQK